MDEIFQRIIFYKMVVYASFGGVIHYLYMYATQNEPWSWTRLMIHIVTSGYVGIIVSETIDDTFQYKAALISICGMSSFEIVKVIEQVVKKNFLYIVDKKLNLKGYLEKQDQDPRGKKPV